MVVVVGPADRLICCWPKPVAAAKRRNALARAAAFRVVSDFETLIRIIVVASRCLLNIDSLSAAEVNRRAALQSRQIACPTAIRQ
jgi:hypothetical protein